MSGIPLLVDAAALDVLIVGGGSVASRKARAMIEAGANVRVVAPVPGADMLDLADSGQLSVEQRSYERGDIADAVLVIAATDDADVNDRIAADARAAHRLVNVVDGGDGGTFVTMATHRSGPLVIGVGAGGVPAASVLIRDAIAARFDARYGRVLQAMGIARSRLLERGERAQWRTRSAAMLNATFCDRVEAGTVAEDMAEWR